MALIKTGGKSNFNFGTVVIQNAGSFPAEIGSYYFVSLLCSTDTVPTMTGCTIETAFVKRTSNSQAQWHEYVGIVKATATTVACSSPSLYAAGSSCYIKLS